MERSRRVKKRKFVYVHDLRIFVTVQFLEDTPAVLSLGEHCKEHGYTCEWPSGREPRLTNNGKQTFCKTENFVPLVVAGLQLPPRHRLRRIHPVPWTQQIREGAAGNCGELVAGPCNEGIPEWLEDFTENLEDSEVSSLAITSQDSDSERPTKVATGMHRIYSHLPKDRNCEVCKRTKMTRAPCRKRTGDAVLRTADHKVLSEG